MELGVTDEDTAVPNSLHVYRQATGRP